MKILVDMNLSPQWVALLSEAGIESIHWSSVGEPRASDRVIMDYAKRRGYVVFTHDLDFGAILAATGAEAPSVVQVRTQDVAPAALGEAIVSLLDRCQDQIERGALICVDSSGERVRILPIDRSES